MLKTEPRWPKTLKIGLVLLKTGQKLGVWVKKVKGEPIWLNQTIGRIEHAHMAGCVGRVDVIMHMIACA